MQDNGNEEESGGFKDPNSGSGAAMRLQANKT